MAQSAHEPMFAQTAALTEVEAGGYGCSLLPEPATRDNLASSKPVPTALLIGGHKLREARRAFFYRLPLQIKRRAENILIGFVTAPMQCVHRGYDAATEMFLLRC